jgi:Holliday junction resolvasome RuvABC endonuclease subunit
MILGIDVSTTCTGFALIDRNGKLQKASFVYIGEYDSIYSKAEAVREEIQSYAAYPMSCIAVEECLLGFRRGGSSSHTLITLARFNGTVAYVAASVMGIDPVTINVSTGRKSLGIVHPKGSNVKEFVAKWFDVQEPDYRWPTKTITRGKLKGSVVNEKGAEDAMDAYVMARAALQMNLSSKCVK